MTIIDQTDRETGTADHLLSRDDLRAWHYAHGDDEQRHQGFHDASMAWTHCTCFGAAYRATEPLVAALAYIHDWAALGGEHGEEPDARIMRFAAAVLDGADPHEAADGSA